MQAAVAIISVSRSIHHKLYFHCHVMYIFPKYFMYVCIYFQNKGIRIRIRMLDVIITLFRLKIKAVCIKQTHATWNDVLLMLQKYMANHK